MSTNVAKQGPIRDRFSIHLQDEVVPSGQAQSSSNVVGKYTDNSYSNVRVVIAQTSVDRVDYIRTLAVKAASRNDFVIAEMSQSSPDHGMTVPQQRAEAFAACVHLSGLDACDIWCDDRHISSRAIAAGTVHISDMRHAWRADIRSPFHVVNFYIPQSALDEIADEQGVSRVEALNCPINLMHTDEVFRNLTSALLPALLRPEQVNRLFADYAARAVIVHLAKGYGSLRVQRQSGGGLAPWQERRAKELLMADLSGDLSLPALASACRLSSSHFSQAFKQTVGCPPHQWLLTQRVERAKQLILNTGQSLSEIALATGFADQSHFTRVFSQRVQTSPGNWRRAQAR